MAASAIAQADTRAQSAEERAAAAEAASERTTATLDELQVWRAELERRLAETTTEPGALRARRAADKRELDRLRSAVGDEVGQAGAPAGSDAEPDRGANGLAAIQAQEIESLAAELAELRSRAARGG